jgi:hypothetical protein
MQAVFVQHSKFGAPMSAMAIQPVWKLKILKLDENDILVFDLELEIEWACNASTSKGLE